MSVTSTAKDAQTWSFPPPGAATPPVDSIAAFGPVHLDDSMVLDWSPNTQPEVGMACFSSLEVRLLIQSRSFAEY